MRSHYRWYWYDSNGHATNSPPKRPNRFNAPYSPDEVSRYYPQYEGRIEVCTNECCNSYHIEARHDET